MDVTLHTTTKIVELEHDGATVPARVWEGHTASGVPVVAFITRITAERDADLTEFQRDLQQASPPSAEVQAWPMRMLID